MKLTPTVTAVKLSKTLFRKGTHFSFTRKVVFTGILLAFLATSATFAIIIQNNTPPKAKPAAVAKVLSIKTPKDPAPVAQEPTPAAPQQNTAPAPPAQPIATQAATCPDGMPRTYSVIANAYLCRGPKLVIAPAAPSLLIIPSVTFSQSDTTLPIFANIFVAASKGTPLNWSVVDNSGLFNLQLAQLVSPSASGTFEITYQRLIVAPGNYAITVTGTDPTTNLSATKTVSVIVQE